MSNTELNNTFSNNTFSNNTSSNNTSSNSTLNKIETHAQFENIKTLLIERKSENRINLIGIGIIYILWVVLLVILMKFTGDNLLSYSPLMILLLFILFMAMVAGVYCLYTLFAINYFLNRLTECSIEEREVDIEYYQGLTFTPVINVASNISANSTLTNSTNHSKGLVKLSAMLTLTTTDTGTDTGIHKVCIIKHGTGLKLNVIIE